MKSIQGWVHIQSAKCTDEDVNLVVGAGRVKCREQISLYIMYNVTAKVAFSSLLYFRTD